MGFKRIARNTIYNGTLSIANTAIYFFMMPFIIEHIGITEFGVYVLVGSLVNYFGLLELGVSTSLVKYVAEYHAKNDKNGLCGIISLTFFFYLGLAVFIALVLVLLGTFFLHYFTIPASLVLKARNIVYVLALAALFTWPLSTFRNVLAGLQRYDTISGLGFLISIGSAIVILLLLSTGFGLIELVIAESFFSVLGLFFLSYRAIKMLGFVPIGLRYLSKQAVLTPIGFSLRVFVVQIAHQISYKTDAIVLGLFLPIRHIALYEAANKIQGVCARVFRIANSSIIPAASELNSAQQSESLRNLYLKGSKYAAGITLSIALPLFIMAKPLLVHWLGAEFEKATLTTQVFVSYWFLTALTGLTGSTLVGIGRVKFLSWLVLIRSVMNLGLSLVLVQRFGILGVVLGTVISEIIQYPILIRYTLKILNLPWSQYIREVAIRACLPLLLASPGLYFVAHLRAPSSLIEVALYGLLYVMIYLLGFYYMSLEPAEKTKVRGYIKRILDLRSLKIPVLKKHQLELDRKLNEGD